MSNGRTDWDVTTVVGALVAFALPLTLLVPDFSVWDVVPKVRVTRFHILSQHLTWSQANVAVIVILSVFFCFYLELRKRKYGFQALDDRMDDIVENVLKASQATESTMEVEKERQAAALRACVDLLDSSTEHYENLVLFREGLRKRENTMKQRPPTIEMSSVEIVFGALTSNDTRQRPRVVDVYNMIDV